MTPIKTPESTSSGYIVILPSILPHHGDTRRDYSPYLITLGCSYSWLRIANQAMRELNKRGISCHLDMVNKIPGSR